MSGLKEKGLELLAKGWQIVPTIQKQKRPVDSGWGVKDYNPAWCKKAILNGYAQCGVGIKCKYSPAVDIDVSDAVVQELMLDFLWDKWGVDFIREGKRPLVFFKTSVPIKKITSKKYTNEMGETQQVELLGEGQQALMFGLHPGGFEYTVNGEVPHHDELTELTYEMAVEIINYFESIVPSSWVEIGSGAVGGAGDGIEKPPLFLADWQVEEYMDASGYDPDDYDQWYRMGVMLYHQYSGEEKGFLLWDAWSKVSSKYGKVDMRQKWSSFHDNRGLTFASVIFAGRELAKKEDIALRDKALSEIKLCTDGDSLMDLLLDYKGLFGEVDIEHVAHVAKTKYKDITGVLLGIAVFRKALKKTVVVGDQWFSEWYYIAEEDLMYNSHKVLTVAPRAFDRSYGHEIVMVDDVFSASDYVLDNSLVTKVDSKMYMPRMGLEYSMNGKSFVNSYQKFECEEREYNEAVAHRFESHCTLIAPDPRTCSLFINFMGHHIRYPGDKIKWAIMLQGVPGDGKSYFAELMKAILGFNNVKIVGTQEVTSKFNTWAEAAQLIFLNEIKITGKDRHEVFNNIKPCITDETISIHPKGGREREVINVANQFITTNFRDAVPIDKTDRRIFPIFSQCGIQSDEYFEELFTQSYNDISTIRDFIRDYPIHPDFKVKGRAPESLDKEILLLNTKNEIDQTIEDEILELNPHINDSYVSVKSICDAIYMQTDERVPPNKISNRLNFLGYNFIGRFESSGKRHRLWSKKKFNKDSILVMFRKNSSYDG